jgi:cysteine protease ATG4
MMLSKSSVFRNTSGGTTSATAAITSRSGNNGADGGDSSKNSSINAAVLVTGPQCTAASSASTADEGGIVEVKSERCETVDVSEEQQQQQHQQQHSQQQHYEQKNPFMKLLASVGEVTGIVVSNNKNNNMSNKAGTIREMDEILGGREVKIVSPMNKRETCGDFDICREYSYSADDDDDNGDEKGSGGRINTNAPPLLPLGASDNTTTGDDTEDQQQQQQVEAVQYAYILGKTYHPLHHYTNRRDDEANLFWFTYRCDFAEIAPYGITSDAGWGCMLRSAQMLLAQALRMHFRGRDWRPPYLLPRRRQDAFMLSIMTWFADYPSSTSEHGSVGSIYSLHNMVAAGLKYDKLPGEWYGPGTAAYVLRDLVELHHQQQQQQKALQKVAINSSNNSSTNGSSSSLLDRRMFRVHVAPQGAVYRDAIQELMTMETRARLETEKKKKHQANPQAHPLDLDWEDDLIEEVGPVEWDTALLLLIPLRLGLKTFNEDYVPAVTNLFSLPQSVGILGGRPRGARWFYGAMAAAESSGKVLALDPHTVQSAPRRRTGRVNGQIKSIVELSDDYLKSCHTSYPEVCDLRKMDPSLALGFYCRNEASLQDLLYNIQKFNQENPKAPELFSIEDMSPDYGANVSSTVNEMMMDSSHNSMMCEDHSDNFDGHHHSDNGSDEDDYVML